MILFTDASATGFMRKLLVTACSLLAVTTRGHRSAVAVFILSPLFVLQPFIWADKAHVLARCSISLFHKKVDTALQSNSSENNWHRNFINISTDNEFSHQIQIFIYFWVNSLRETQVSFLVIRNTSQSLTNIGQPCFIGTVTSIYLPEG